MEQVSLGDPQALAFFLKNVLDRFELTVQVKEHKVKTDCSSRGRDRIQMDKHVRQTMEHLFTAKLSRYPLKAKAELCSVVHSREAKGV